MSGERGGSRGRKRKTYLWDEQAEIPARTARRYRQSTPDPSVSCDSSSDDLVGVDDISDVDEDEVTDVSGMCMISDEDSSTSDTFKSGIIIIR